VQKDETGARSELPKGMSREKDFLAASGGIERHPQVMSTVTFLFTQEVIGW